MADFVAAFALIQCSMGTAPGPLQIVPGHAVTVNQRVVATTLDNVPMVNIPSFGMCQSPSNPTVATATTAAMGVLTPMPCIPVIPAPWTPGSVTVTISNRTVLTGSSQCLCAYGGAITIKNSGTSGVTSG